MTVVRAERLADNPRVARITLDRPARRNSLVWDTWKELDEVLTDIEDSDVGAVVFTGAGGFFSSGGDRDTSTAHGLRAMARGARIERAQHVINQLRQLSVPVVAAVEGGAVGLGWSLALSCDLIVAAQDAVFRAPFVQLGLVPDGGATWVLLNRLGRQRAAAILWLGEPVSAPECFGLGLVTSVCAPGRALEVATELASTLAGYDARAVELSRRLMYDAENTALDDYLRTELLVATQIQLGRDAAAAEATTSGREGSA